MAPLSFEALEKALVQLEQGLRHAAAHPADDVIRDGVIQRFEYSMDLSWKLIQRYLKQVAQLDDAALRTKKDLFREAARLGFIEAPEPWFAFYEARNETSHTYDPSTAAAVFVQAAPFLAAAKGLLQAMRDAA